MAQTIKPQPERIRRIKEAKAKKGLTYQAIVDTALNMQEYTSIASVYRVFAKDSENVGFRDATLRPIERVLGLDDAAAPARGPSSDYLKQIISELNEQLKSSRRAHVWKNASIAFLIVLLVALLAVDRVLPEVGWYGTDGTAAWWIIASLLAAFIVSVAAFHIHLRVLRDKQERGEK